MAQISYGTITITDTTDINKIENWYLATSAGSGVTRDTSGWTTTVQSMTSTKQYLWNYEKIYGTGLNNTDVLISQTDPIIIGRYGQNGQSGADGNSITSIDEYYQVTNSTTNPGSSGWQKNTLVTPTSTNKYLWNYQVINYSKTAAEGSYTDARIIGVYGDTGPQGPQGNPGTNGINTATVYLYQRATSVPSKPSGTLTYTFSSASITSGTLGNWKQSIGELTGTDPIWVIAAVASSNGTTDTIASSEWSTQIKLAQNGTDGQPGGQGAAGLNQATVYIYKRGDSVTKPNNSTYTFSTGEFTLSDNTWNKTIPSTPAGKPCWVSSAVAIGNGTTATLAWNTPSVLVEDGTDGISPTVTSTSNGVKIVDANGNETYITNGANGQSYYTYVRYSANSNGSNYQPTPDASRPYIGVYSGTSSTVPAYNDSGWTWSKYLGTDGTPGVDGVSVTAVKEIYYLTTGNAPTAPSAGTTTTSTSTGTDVWTTVVPTYIPNGKYYTSIQTTLSKGTSPISSTAILNNALTDESYRAWEALSISQNANENAQGAMAQAAEAQYQTEALAAKVKHYWWDSTGAHIASGINGADVTEGIASTYGFNSLVGLASMTFGYNSYKTVELDGSIPALKFYKPSKTAQGDLTATLDSNGLVLSEGGVKAGTAGQSGFIYLSTKNYGSNLTINNHQASNWREIIGTKFGVDADGNLYASNAEISGKITVGSGSDLSAGLSDYSTTSQMNSAIGTATNDMATKTYVGNQGYQNANQVNTIIEGKGYALNSDLTAEINQRKAQYGTSSTSASTRTKVVTCANFELIAGNEITVKFSTANTYISNSVQLNVNGKGAKDIWVANAVTSSTNQLLWGANAYITFKYDGTQFIVIGEPRTWYGASTTAAATAAKTDTTAVTGCVICKGAKIELAMSNNNTSASATLNIQSTGAKNIYYGNTTTSPTVDNGHSWLGASTATFTFDGASYRMAGQTVISGDSITTGTISANRLNISDIISNGSIAVVSQIPTDVSDLNNDTGFITSASVPTKVSQLTNDSKFQTDTNVSNTISNTNVSALNDGGDYTKTVNLGNTTAVQNAAKTASNYLGDTDSNAGVTLKAQNGTTTANVSTSNYIKINTSGLEVFKSGVSVALYGDTARIGKTNNSAFYINSNSLQAYYMNGSTRTLYFEVSPTGIKYGPSLNTTVATTSQIPTTVASLSDASDYATKVDAQGYANTAEANASYSIEVKVTAIDYANSSATLVAVPYYQGSTTLPTLPSGASYSYRWYKGTTALSNTSTAPTISGATTATLVLGQGSDLAATYICVISKP